MASESRIADGIKQKAYTAATKGSKSQATIYHNTHYPFKTPLYYIHGLISRKNRYFGQFYTNNIVLSKIENAKSPAAASLYPVSNPAVQQASKVVEVKELIYSMKQTLEARPNLQELKSR